VQPLWAGDTSADRGATWRNGQSGAATSSRPSRLKWRAPRQEAPPAADASVGPESESSTLRAVEPAAHVSGQIDDEDPLRRGAALSRSAASEARRSRARRAEGQVSTAHGEAGDADDASVRAVLLEPARLTIDAAEAEEYLPAAGEDAEFDPESADATQLLPSARPFNVSQPVDEGDANDLPMRGGAAEGLPMPNGADAGVVQSDEGYNRPLNCDEECPSPSDPRLLGDLLSISIDITDPLPDRDLESRQADRGDRCWRGADGETFVARFGGFRDGQVLLVLADGTERRVALADLHPLDRRHLYDLPQECSLGDENFEGRAWLATLYNWKASSLCHKPLHFEEVALERYGHDWGPYLQPVISGAHFFGTVPLLPYHIGLEPCCECIYALGYYRPGSCAPYMIYPVPLSARAAVLQAAAVAGVVGVVP